MGIRALMEIDMALTDDSNDVNAAFVGRTIRHIDTQNINQWTFTFVDGGKVSVDTVNKGAFYGPVLVAE